ncbi:MAG: hypothetical protein ABL999_14760 [Pyrinomonadaceae bacterium]
MGAKTIQGIRFNAYSNDHDPPHIDAEVDGMKMKMIFGSDDAPPEIGPMNPRIKSNDAKRAFRIFLANQGRLRKLFNETEDKRKGNGKKS